MLRRPTRRRAGNTLVEVLVGFGILGIGVTSVITLFPFSALTIGQALRDDRTTTCAVIADGELRDIHSRYVVEPGDKKAQEQYQFAMDNPGLSNNPNAVSSSLAPLNGTESEPSYPVFVDPMGVVAGRGPVGDSGQTGIPRVNLQVWDPQTQQMVSLSQQMALRFCSLMDSLTFDDGKVPSNPTDMRELRYNFAWALQRPVNRDRYTVRMQVVVFNKRAPLYTPQGSEAVYGNVRFIPGEATIYNVPANTEIRKGTWVMDATLAANKDGDGATRQLRHAEFYRVVSVTDQGNGTVALEVHKPVARPDGMINLSVTSTYAYQGSLVVMPGVADVFERPNLINSSR